MSELYLEPDKIFLIYARVQYGKEEQFNYDIGDQLGLTAYQLVSATFSEKDANEEIKKDPSNLIKKVIEFEKRIALSEKRVELMGV